MMRTRWTVTLLLTWALSAATCAAAARGERAAGPTPLRLSFTDGDVSFWRPGAEDWAPAQVNTPLAEELELCPGLGDEAVGLAQVALERRRKLRQRLDRLSQRTDEFQRRAQGRDHCGRAALPSLRTFCICHRAILIMSGRLSPSLRTTEGSKPECILQLRQRGSWRVSQ